MTDIKHALITEAEGIHQPKGVSNATSNQVYVANGTGTGDWTDINDFIQYSSICVYYDQGTSGTRVISSGDANTILPLALTYISDCDNNFSYNDTTKVVEYTGTPTLISRFDASFSVAMTVGTGITLEVWLQENQGSGWVTIDRTLAMRKFATNDVGIGGMTALLPVESGYQYRPVFRVDGACTIDVENITYNFTGLRDLSI